MEAFKLSRKNMADLLLSLNSPTEPSPLTVLQETWSSSHEDKIKNGKTLNAFLSTEMPAIFEKCIKAENEEIGFSINEIVSLGNQIEFTNFSPSAVQNWVKREVKELIGTPQIGRKYTVDQAAILFIVEDLKAALDFESIRNVLALIFNNPEDRTDDMVNPVDLYSAYASVFDKIHRHSAPSLQEASSLNGCVAALIKEECQTFLPVFKGADQENLHIVLNVLISSTLTVQAAYYQLLARKYAGAALFLKGM
ncbi:DUF1836 domain-containing protein [Rossellomorea vietnamensis]|uniref:DUF1836 domain-containing protein n=1 Tax=Rossellomorea aquimaris TaxID=189382 RepID=A0A5D4TLA2_9BACI|nr:DUF1836 domain-containing protein [Rossellomorea aquimaris]TYS74974.1 DUF1836 domain-containing protein [Rossellomorea aquimaris]